MRASGVGVALYILRLANKMGKPKREGGEALSVLQPTLGSVSSQKPLLPSKFTVYKQRWVVLSLFGLLTLTNAALWITFAPVANIIREQYDVGNFMVNSLSMIYMVGYIPMVFPASWLLEKGLRIGILVGTFLNTIGAWMRFGGHGNFILLFAGQTVASIAQAFILGVPPLLAAAWFGPREWALATSLGVLANQVGVAIGFVGPSLLVWDHDSLQRYMLIQAIVCTAVLVLIVCFFEDAPPTPPSRAAQHKAAGKMDLPKGSSKKAYARDVKALHLDMSFVCLLMAYGIAVGAFYAVSTLIEQILSPRFPGHNADYGFIGFTIILAGLLGTVIVGFILDKTKAYHVVTTFIYALTAASMVGFVLTAKWGPLYSVYISSAVLGLTMTALIPGGFELAAEITYPIAESTSAGLLNCWAQIFGIIFTIVMGYALEKWSWDGANWMCVGFVVGGLICMMFVKGEALRHAVESNQSHTNLAMEFADSTIDIETPNGPTPAMHRTNRTESAFVESI